MEETNNTGFEEDDDVDAKSSMHHLPVSTVRLITSSQVITSVLSVVKELLENALDAGATSIDIKLEGYGLEKVEVRDNGFGIKPCDAPYMARPHYTSKIASTKDLESLTTYGFRGEALGSLCSVSSLSITSKTAEDDISVTYTTDHTGQVTHTKPSHLGQGTTVTVLNLFKNLPVRKQYYNTAKKKKEELKKVEDLVLAFGVSNHGVRLALRHGKELIWQKSAVNDPRSALMIVFGTAVVNQMVHIERESTDLMVKIEAFMPKKSSSSQLTGRTNPDRCFILVNKRPVYLKEVEKMLRQYFINGLNCDSNRFPVAYMHITAAANCIDVNVDPNKTKVMLHKMEEILTFLRSILEEVYGPLKEHEEQHTKQHNEVTLEDSVMSNQEREFLQDKGVITTCTSVDGGKPRVSIEIDIQEKENVCSDNMEKKQSNLSCSIFEHSAISNLGDPVCHSTMVNASDASKSFPAELSDLELLQALSENGGDAGYSDGNSEQERADNPASAIEKSGHTPVPLTQSLNFDLSMDNDDDDLFSVDFEQSSRAKASGNNLFKSADETNGMSEPKQGPKNSLERESKDSSDTFYLLLESSGTSSESSAPHSGETFCASGPEPGASTEAVVPGQMLADAVTSEEKEHSPSISTSSDWSRGVTVQKPSGSAVQPVCLLQPITAKQDSSSLKMPSSQSTPQAIRKKPFELSPSQTTLYDLVGNCTVKRPTTAYIYFSKEIRPEVVTQNPKAGFQEIARLIGERWKALSEAEKQKYETLMTKDVQRYREQIKLASSNNNNKSTTSAKKLNMQCKRRKIEIEQDTSVSQASVSLNCSSKRIKVLPDVKTVTVKFSLLALKQKVSSGPRLSQSQQPQQPELFNSINPIGQLKSHATWLCLHGNHIATVQPIRAQEELLHKELLSSHCLPMVLLDNPISLDKGAFSDEEWTALAQMKKSSKAPVDSHTYYTDHRLVSNGFQIREVADDAGHQLRTEICHLTDRLNFYGVKELKEILHQVVKDRHIPLDRCRPARVKHYIQGEAVRRARQLPQRVTKQQLMDIMQRVSKHLDKTQTTCFHNKPFWTILYDLETVQNSQSSQSLSQNT